MSVDLSKLAKRLRKAQENRAGSGAGDGEGDGAGGGQGGGQPRRQQPARPQQPAQPRQQSQQRQQPSQQGGGSGAEDAFDEFDQHSSGGEDDAESERQTLSDQQGDSGGRISLTPAMDRPDRWIEEEEEDEIKNEEEISKEYPLIPNEPEEGETVYARARIEYDHDRDELVYHVIEPELDERKSQILDTVEELLKEKIDVDFGQLKKQEARQYLQERVAEILDNHNFGLDQNGRQIIQYFAYRNFVGLDEIEPLMNDKKIEDISCDGSGVPIYVYHRNPNIGSVKTDVVFNDDDRLDSFVRKLAQRCGRSISMAEPLLDGSLPDGSRVQATLGTDIARRGTNFTIRRFTEEPLTPVHLMEYGTINSEMLAYIWMAVEQGKSILVSGATAAGKTTLLNAFSLFIKPSLKIVSIEDTPELRLPHPNWVPEVAREGFGFGEQQTGQVTLDDLLKESLRQRPDYIIVGEVRGEEAYILFQQIATGHPGMSTIHASSVDKVMDRLTTKPIDLPPSLIENLDLIVFAKRARREGSYVRRVDSIYEFEDYDKQRDEPLVNQVFDWDAREDVFNNIGESSLLSEIATDMGVDPSEIQEEILRRQKVLRWMRRRGIKHYEDVGRVLTMFYNHPDELMERVEEEL